MMVKVKEHSKFWKTLKSQLSDYKNRFLKIKRHGPFLSFSNMDWE